MFIRFVCPICRAIYSAQEADVGKKAACKVCGQRLQVPSMSVPAPPAIDGPGKSALSEARESVPGEQRDAERLLGSTDFGSGVQKKTFGIAVALVLVGFLGVGLAIVFLASGVEKAQDSVPVPESNVRDGEDGSWRNRLDEPSKSSSKSPDETSVRSPKKAVGSLPGKATETSPKESVERLPKQSSEEPPKETAENQPLSGEEVYRRVVRSTVYIQVGQRGGSGFVVNRAERIIVTNYHVVGQEDIVEILFPIYDATGSLVTDPNRYRNSKREIVQKGTVLFRDSSIDLAIVRSESIPIRSSAIVLSKKPAATGSVVYSVGGSGVGENLLWRLTKGTVRGRAKRQLKADFGEVECVILETDAPVNPGDSGGPVANDRGELVAVTSHFHRDLRQVSGNIDVEEVRKYLAKKSVRVSKPDPDDPEELRRQKIAEQAERAEEARQQRLLELEVEKKRLENEEIAKKLRLEEIAEKARQREEAEKLLRAKEKKLHEMQRQRQLFVKLVAARAKAEKDSEAAGKGVSDPLMRLNIMERAWNASWERSARDLDLSVSRATELWKLGRSENWPSE